MAALDHVVINTLKSMDAAADLFAALGFCLTPRGHHSLGSINHLAIDSFTVSSPEPEEDAHRLAAAFESKVTPVADGWCIWLDDADVPVVPGATAGFRTATLRFSSVDEIAARAKARSDAGWQALGADGAVLSLPAFDLNLTCRSSR